MFPGKCCSLVILKFFTLVSTHIIVEHMDSDQLTFDKADIIQGIYEVHTIYANRYCKYTHNKIYFYSLHPFLPVGYQMKNHAWCSPYRNELFHTLSEAKKRCNEDSRCVMIYDDGGVEETFLLCDEGARLSSSPSGSRLYIKDLFVDGGNYGITMFIVKMMDYNK